MNVLPWEFDKYEEKIKLKETANEEQMKRQKYTDMTDQQLQSIKNHCKCAALCQRRY